MGIYNERWKAIEGYEGIYEISDHGRVKSLYQPAKPGQGNYAREEQILKPDLVAGYHRVRLYKDRKPKRHLVHRLVAKHFCDGYAEGLECCHNDGNPLNNHYTNLRWDTRKGNAADRVKHGTQQRGEQNSTSKLTDSKVISIVDDLNSGMKETEIAKKHNVYRTTINRIKLGRTWTHITKDHPITIN
jgi:hypothetical protein